MKTKVISNIFQLKLALAVIAVLTASVSATDVYQGEVQDILIATCQGCHSDTGQANLKVDFSDSTAVLAIADMLDTNENWRQQISQQEDLSTVLVFLESIEEPVHLSLSPADDDTGVGINDNLVITFNEPVTAESGNVVIRLASDSSVFETIDVTSDQVTGSGTDMIIIDPEGAFAEGMEYYVLVDSGAFEDTSGIGYDGISDASTWSFNTEDLTVSISALNAASIGVTASLEKRKGSEALVNIKLHLIHDDFIELSVFNASGNLIKSVPNEYKTAGEHQWNVMIGRMPEGTYFLKVKIGSRFFWRTVAKGC
jgi:hypothetical protein